MLHQSKDPTAKVKLTAAWKPIAGLGELVGKSYVAPIGALRIRFIKATDLRNPEASLIGGKADPYMRVMLNSKLLARTVTIKNEQNPVWNEIVYLPIKSSKAKIILEVMDYQARTKDRSLGALELDLSSIIRQDSDGTYLEYTESIARSAPFSGKDAKGYLHYEISFHPALNVMTFEEERQADNEAAETAKASVSNQPPLTSGEVSSEASSVNLDQTITHSRSFSTVTNASSKRTLEPPKIRLSLNDLGKYYSGFLVFDLLEGQLPQAGCYLQVLFDDHLYPAYTTTKARSHRVHWNETGEGFIRELDVSNIVLRITKDNESDEQDQIVASSVEGTFAALRRSFVSCLLMVNPKLLICPEQCQFVSAQDQRRSYLPDYLQMSFHSSFDKARSPRIYQ